MQLFFLIFPVRFVIVFLRPDAQRGSVIDDRYYYYADRPADGSVAVREPSLDFLTNAPTDAVVAVVPLLLRSSVVIVFGTTTAGREAARDK